MIICGIDPGKNGAMVALDTDSDWAKFCLLPLDKAKLLDGKAVARFLRESKVDYIVAEKVQGRGGWSATVNFSFGFGFGQVLQIIVLTKIPYVLIDPKKWQSLIHDGIPFKLESKEKSQLAYKRLFPHFPIPLGKRNGKTHDGILDAMLIATYGVLKYGNGSIKKWTFEVKDESTANN